MLSFPIFRPLPRTRVSLQKIFLARETVIKCGHSINLVELLKEVSMVTHVFHYNVATKALARVCSIRLYIHACGSTFNV